MVGFEQVEDFGEVVAQEEGGFVAGYFVGPVFGRAGTGEVAEDFVEAGGGGGGDFLHGVGVDADADVGGVVEELVFGVHGIAPRDIRRYPTERIYRNIVQGQ